MSRDSRGTVSLHEDFSASGLRFHSRYTLGWFYFPPPFLSVIADAEKRSSINNQLSPCTVGKTDPVRRQSQLGACNPCARRRCKVDSIYKRLCDSLVRSLCLLFSGSVYRISLFLFTESRTCNGVVFSMLSKRRNKSNSRRQRGKCISF